MKRDASPGSVHDSGCLGLVRWEGPGGWYGEVGREEGSGWGACDFFLKNKIKKKKKKKKEHFELSDYIKAKLPLYLLATNTSSNLSISLFRSS